MDRSTSIGFVLIALILLVWMWLNTPPPQQVKNTITEDTAFIATQPSKLEGASLTQARQSQKSAEDTLGVFFAARAIGTQKRLRVETDDYIVTLSSKGAAVISWELKKYKTWDQHPVNLIQNQEDGELGLVFYSSDGKLITTNPLFFDVDYLHEQHITLSGTDSVTIFFTLPVDTLRRITKVYTFRNGDYAFGVKYEFERMGDIISNYEYQVTWESGLRYPEFNSVDESGFARAYIYAGDEITEADATSFSSQVTEDVSGKVDWVATTNKYFGVAIMPIGIESMGASIRGKKHPLPDEGERKEYSFALRMPFLGKEKETSQFMVFLGPLDFDIVKSYDVGLDHIMRLGAAWIIRPIAEYIIIPLFQFLRYLIPNYGVVLIVFSIIVKIVLHPLTKTTMNSMRKMQALQPMINEIREKYKDDHQKMNIQIMRLYKEYGVNPAGGCLPLLLQLPILFALWTVFSSAIELRQASFIWWINDLSVPDVIAKLPFSFLGIKQISGLALAMGITMFIQQKMTVKDPRQKMLVWLMPIMMTLLFNYFPAGLNLYYFVFNLLSIGHQWWFTKRHKDEPLKKVEEKKRRSGIFNTLSKNFPTVKK